MERVTYRMLGDGVGGRVNAASDQEFSDKNKALRTTGYQTSGKRIQCPIFVFAIECVQTEES